MNLIRPFGIISDISLVLLLNASRNELVLTDPSVNNNMNDLLKVTSLFIILNFKLKGGLEITQSHCFNNVVASSLKKSSPCCPRILNLSLLKYL